MAVQLKKSAALEAISAFLLSEGLDQTGIRTLGKAAGISDRMLIYYFGNKDQLIEDVLAHVSEQTALGLQMLAGSEKQESHALLKLLEEAMNIPDFRNAMLLFLEVAARGARGIEPFRTSAKSTVAFWHSWLSEHLISGPGEMSPQYLLTQIEGWIFLRLIEEG